MAFVCECGFQAKLSAQQRQRLATSGGRAKCPKCGKICTVSELDVATDDSPELATESPTSIENALGLNLDEPRQPIEMSETVKTAGTNVAALAPSKLKQRLPLALSSLALLISVAAFFRPTLQSQDDKDVKSETRLSALEDAFNKLDEVIDQRAMDIAIKWSRVRETTTFLKGRGVILIDDDKRERFRMGTNSEQEAVMEILDRDGKPRVVLNVKADGSSSVQSLNASGRMRTMMGQIDGGMSAVTVYDYSGTPVKVLADR